MISIPNNHSIRLFFYTLISILFLFACGESDNNSDVVITPIIETPASIKSSVEPKDSKPPIQKVDDTNSIDSSGAVTDTSQNSIVTDDKNSDDNVDDDKEKEDIVHSIVDLHKRFGEPPTANYARLSIPALDIDAPVGLSVITDGIMTNPIGPSDVVYYDFQDAWVNFGGDIGTRTNAIFSGHVDYVANVDWADIRYEGVGVFFNISLLSPGDVINIRVGERTYVYGVVWRRMTPADSDEWESILRKETGLDMITLITCTGEFDPKTLEYAERTVVRAHRM